MPKESRGQTLIEVVLAVAIAVIVVYALVALATLSMTYAQPALRRSEATKLANAGMEAFRLERDIQGFNTSDCLTANSLTTYIIKSPPEIVGNCYFLGTSANPYEEIAIRNVTYRRTMRVEDPGPTNIKNVKVTVNWTEGSSERSVTMTGVLTNWR